MTLRLPARLMALCAALLAGPALAEHLWYNDPGAGDIMMLDVNVAATAQTTYYETLGWNQGGEAGGYTGIQTSPRGSQIIFSIWDPVAVKGVPIRAVYQKPGALVEPFGGEGTGLHYLDVGTGWKVGTTVKTLVRSWPYNGHTYFALWSYDYGTGKWTHHTTFDFPVANVGFSYGAMSFLENWTGNDPGATRMAYYFNGWKRVNAGSWYPFNRATGDKDGEFGTSDNRYFLKTGPNPVTGFKNPLTVAVSDKSPVLSKTQLTTSSASFDATANSVTVAWQLSDSGAPQFGYSIDIVNAASGARVAGTTDIAPHIRSATVKLPAGSPAPEQLRARLAIRNVIDETVQGADLNLVALSGPPATGALYTLRPQSAAQVLAVDQASTAAAAPLTLTGYSGQAAQQWLLDTSSVAGQYVLKAGHSYQCADVTGSSSASGAKVIQYPCTGNPNQRLSLTSLGNNSYTVRFAHSNLCLTGTVPVTQASCSGTANQQWQFSATGATAAARQLKR